MVNELSTLPPLLASVFASACAQRMLPTYEWFHARTGRGSPNDLRDALEELWADLEGNLSSSLKLKLQVVERLIPGEDENWVDECAYAQNAGAAVFYAIRSRLTQDVQDAAWAARQVYEVLDYRITNRDAVFLHRAEAEDKIVSDPLIQAELQRQKRDLGSLKAGGESADAVRRMRSISQAEASDVLDLA